LAIDVHVNGCIRLTFVAPSVGDVNVEISCACEATLNVLSRKRQTPPTFVERRAYSVCPMGRFAARYDVCNVSPLFTILRRACAA
jgi:hypothetical protein